MFEFVQSIRARRSQPFSKPMKIITRNINHGEFDSYRESRRLANMKHEVTDLPQPSSNLQQNTFSDILRHQEKTTPGIS